MLDRQEVKVHEPIHTVGQTSLLPTIQLPALHSAGHALGPANLRKLVCLCIKQQQNYQLLFFLFFSVFLSFQYKIILEAAK